MVKPILAEDGIEADVFKWEWVSQACLTAIAAERERDPRSLTGKEEALEGSNSRLLWREFRTNSKSLSLLPLFSSLFMIKVSRLEGSEFFELKW